MTANNMSMGKFMAVEFAVFFLCMKGFNVLATYCGRAYSICNK